MENITKDEINIINKCKSYCYQGKNISSVNVMIGAFIILLICVFFSFYFAYNNQDAKIIVVIFIGFLVMISYIIKKMQFDTMKILTQYFKDENNEYYKIQFTNISTKIVRIQRVYSLIPLVGEVKTFINAYKALEYKDELLESAFEDAQSKLMAYYYVKRFKNGIQDWNIWHGGEAKVIPLGSLEHIVKEKYKSTCNNKTKIIKIDKCYGIVE